MRGPEGLGGDGVAAGSWNAEQKSGNVVAGGLIGFVPGATAALNLGPGVVGVEVGTTADNIVVGLPEAQVEAGMDRVLLFDPGNGWEHVK